MVMLEGKFKLNVNEIMGEITNCGNVNTAAV